MTAETDIRSSFLFFAREILKLNPYWWQDDASSWFDEASVKLVQGSVCTPNGSGKSSVLIPTLGLGWPFFYPRGRVVFTTADGKQLDHQVMPALNAHRAKFPSWDFLEREIRTPTGGKFIGFTTDDAGRAEGWHKLDDTEGPLLIIVDEAKTVPDAIFQAIDRCTYNAILLTSSPGRMSGQFYDSQFKPELGFNRLRVGLKDCPHITQDKIDRILAKYGPNSPYTRSTLHGEFIETYAGAPVFYAYSQQYHEWDNLDWPRGAILCVGMDVGTRNSSVITAVKEDSKGNVHVWVMREIILAESDTERQAIALLQVLAAEFPFWNAGSEVCPQTLFFCDPAARNSSFTSRGPNSSALSVLQSHGIHPGFKIGLGLQPSIAVVNRVLQQHHMVETIDFETKAKKFQAAWHFRISKEGCPELTHAMAARYRYPARGEPGYGKDEPMKGISCDHADHVCFVAGTQISTPIGNRSISKLKIGDMVKTRKGARKIIAKWSRIASVWRFNFGPRKSAVCTRDHPFFNAALGKMIPIHKWQEFKDFGVESNGGTIEFTGKTKKRHQWWKRRRVFNITVEGEHEYFANGILVSNCDAFRYMLCNVLSLAEENHLGGMRARYEESNPNIEPSRSI